MCGISGVINLNQRPVSGVEIVNMTDEMVSRGPDGEGYLLTNSPDFCSALKEKRPKAVVVNVNHNQQLAFGHRRLSIVDLSTEAAQPMTESSKRYWIVFNGEIYNHADLRIQLKSLGYKFNTDHSDTEVILNAYACWGVECLQKFNGMWAFCIWDSLDNTFFLARDRAGKKPLYYAQHNNTLYFASELKAILLNKEIPRKLDDKAVYDYLTYMMVPAPQTIFKDIYKMPAAHYLLFKPGQELTLTRYWSPFTNKSYFETSEKHILEELREKIYEATRIRIIADVEVGVLLSGGLDSSISLACASKFATKPVKAFSVGFENKDGYKNEFEYARKVAEQFKADYNEVIVTEKDFLDFFPEMIYLQGEPIADSANIPIYYIAKAAREKGVKVLLGGEGSDELFVGYKLWKIARQFSNLLEGRPNLAAVTKFLHKNTPVHNRRLFYYSWYEKIKNQQPIFWSGTELRSEKKKNEILSNGFKERLGNYNSFNSIKSYHESYSSIKGLDQYEWMTATDLQYRLPDLLLARLDRMLMAASVEGRNPFLDINVIEYAMKIPAHLKVAKGEEKYILKKAFEGILPNDIIYRQKDSFTVPLTRLFNNKEFRNRTSESIHKFNASTGIFSEDYINSLKKDSNNSSELWNISNLALWYEKYC